MITTVDTNVIMALWNDADELNRIARTALDSALDRGQLVICGAVFAELLASPGRTEAFIDQFLRETSIQIDWNVSQSIWRSAGRAFRSYASRRKRHGSTEPSRILADFLIGAHAVEIHSVLLTFDAGVYRTAFPQLRIQLFDG